MYRLLGEAMMKMSNEPLFLEPYFQEKIWGGDRLHTEYGYQIDRKSTRLNSSH